METEPFLEWMSGRSRTSEVPPRAGYYFGWRTAQALGRRRTLPELARLPEVEVRRDMALELRSLVDGNGSKRAFIHDEA